jgi:hypothetical protein
MVFVNRGFSRNSQRADYAYGLYIRIAASQTHARADSDRMDGNCPNHDPHTDAAEQFDDSAA